MTDEDTEAQRWKVGPIRPVGAQPPPMWYSHITSVFVLLTEALSAGVNPHALSLPDQPNLEEWDGWVPKPGKEPHHLSGVVHNHSCFGSLNLLFCQTKVRTSRRTAQEDLSQGCSLRHPTKMIPGNQGDDLEEVTLTPWGRKMGGGLAKEGSCRALST